MCARVCMHIPAAHQPSPLTVMVVAPLNTMGLISGLGRLDCKWYAVEFTVPFLFIAGLKMLV